MNYHNPAQSLIRRVQERGLEAPGQSQRFEHTTWWMRSTKTLRYGGGGDYDHGDDNGDDGGNGDGDSNDGVNGGDDDGANGGGDDDDDGVNGDDDGDGDDDDDDALTPRLRAQCGAVVTR